MTLLIRFIVCVKKGVLFVFWYFMNVMRFYHGIFLNCMVLNLSCVIIKHVLPSSSTFLAFDGQVDYLAPATPLSYNPNTNRILQREFKLSFTAHGFHRVLSGHVIFLIFKVIHNRPKESSIDIHKYHSVHNPEQPCILTYAEPILRYCPSNIFRVYLIMCTITPPHC